MDKSHSKSFLPGDKSPGKSPPNIKLWPETSWKKYFISYIIQHDLYFVYPRQSLTTNFGDEGSNHRISENLFQVPLQMEHKEYRFIPFTDSNAVYDAWCEINPGRLLRLAPSLEGKEIEVDLYGMKSGEDSSKDFFLSSRKCSKPLLKFAREMKPHEMNIIAGVPGDYFSLGAKKDFQELNYFISLLKCHEKKELAYWYSIREYHFYRNRLLTLENSTNLFFNPGFLFRKFFTMMSYTFQYFKKK